jgi:hypothetical protein
MKMFRLLSVTILNCLIICRANSGQSKIDHCKFRVNLVQALLIEHGREIEKKVEGRHSTEKNVPSLLERHFPERIPPTGKKARPTKGRRQRFDAWTVRLDFALEDVSRHSTPSYTFKARFYYTFEEIRDS